MKNILCYGDSNTWGQVPLPFKDFVKKRHPIEIRWTGVLQKLAANRYRVIEEGLNGRTTGPEDPIREGRSGRGYLAPCIDSHVPLDLVIFMLGTNDLKKKFNPDPKVIANRMREMVQTTRILCAQPPAQTAQILVMAPVIPKLQFLYEDFQYPELEDFARRQVSLYEEMCKQEGAHFLDASAHLEASSIDGAHLEPAMHQSFGAVVFEKVNRILS